MRPSAAVNSLLVDCASGALVGFALHPIDSVKTRLQSGRGNGLHVFAGVRWAMISEAEEAIYTLSFRNLLLNATAPLMPLFIAQLLATLLAETVGGVAIHCTSEGRKRCAQMGFSLSDMKGSRWEYLAACRFFILRRVSVPAVVWSVDFVAPLHRRLVMVTFAALVCGYLASPFDTLYSNDLSSLLPVTEVPGSHSLFSWYRGIYVALYWGLLMSVNSILVNLTPFPFTTQHL